MPDTGSTPPEQHQHPITAPAVWLCPGCEADNADGASMCHRCHHVRPTFAGPNPHGIRVQVQPPTASGPWPSTGAAPTPSLDRFLIGADTPLTIRQGGPLKHHGAICRGCGSPAGSHAQGACPGPFSRRKVDPRDLLLSPPQPPPVDGDPREVLALVLLDLPVLLGGADALACGDFLRARSELGRERYGTTLRVENGRDALVDWLQEAGDAVMYGQQVCARPGGERFRPHYLQAVALLAALLREVER